LNKIIKANSEQAKQLFDIMVRATEIGCRLFYPSEIISIWHKGRSAEGMADFIGQTNIYCILSKNTIRGFVHFDDTEIIGLFIDPDYHRKGYGSELFHFSVDKIKNRPIIIKSTLNAVSFYLRMGCHCVSTELVRRHDRDIYVKNMEWV
jgi:GNAT superfamily N-acetyltransferase